MRLERAWWLASCLVACPSTASQPAERSTDQVAVNGTLNIQIPFDAISVSEVAYTVTRSGQPERQGKFIVDGASYLRALVGGLASGSDLIVTLRADARWRATGLSTSCVAINAFAIYPGQTTALAIVLSCDAVPASDAGPAGAAVGGNVCPIIQDIHAIPGQAPVGSEVVVKADVLDADEGPERLHYAWGADYGVFTDASSARAVFSCTEPGDATLSLSVSDGDPTCPNQAVVVYVKCLDSLDPQAAAGQGPGGSSAATGAVSPPTAGFASAGAVASGAGAAGQRAGASGSGSAGASAAKAAAVSGAGSGSASAAGTAGAAVSGAGGSVTQTSGSGDSRRNWPVWRN
jgi:hypothetical protein